ncbi:LacI family DNA-binding transcriptional regulator [Salinicoccus halitifaciens]|uniref:LacI family kdg operon repressor n=1 Tax=Salinicoccus halitifaciens TaxID=1073415 RepID=A0ABV2E7Y2_9STAP|nr:LacI family DNA-binding transcriptional regulator [Salinicoccus halitifaciens]MCD2136409.1 LacI family transcriptional regulator [Salinicoccus halitifaciens]
MKRITIKDVAEHAGVSISTVSQYINGRYSYMGEETKRRIEEAVRELGYRPNFMARNLKKRSTRTIGIIVSNILHHFAVSVTRKIEDYCDADGYSLIICNADDDPAKEEKYINNLLEKQVDGLVIMPTAGNDALYRKLAEQKFPVVFIDRFMEGVDIPSFKLDNRHAVGLSYDYLRRQQVENCYYIGASNVMDITPRTERLEAFKKLAPGGKIITGENERLYNRIEEEFTDGQSNGIILANDFALMAFLEYAKQQGLDLVEANKVIAIDDPPLAGVYNPSIPTIAQPIEEIAQNAYRQLMRHIEGEGRATKMVNNYKGKIVER